MTTQLHLTHHSDLWILYIGRFCKGLVVLGESSVRQATPSTPSKVVYASVFGGIQTTLSWRLHSGSYDAKLKRLAQ